MPESTLKPFTEWIGRTSETDDVLTERLADSFRAIFAPNLAPVPEGEAPLGIHWCLSPPIASMAELGSDGHPVKNLSLPPVPQPRRMWAGGEIDTLQPLRVGERVRRVSTIRDIVRKQGRSGELWFVTVGHDYSTDRGLAIRERHDIVYREAASPDAAVAVPITGEAAAAAAVGVSPDGWVVETPPTLLFRYSAITFNGHRIHYDLPYATGVEGYPGLVVHGPIQATLLFNLASTRAGGPPKRFAYRGLSPAFAGAPILVRPDPKGGGRFCTESSSGTVHMQATAESE